jgi:hypothetical protein
MPADSGRNRARRLRDLPHQTDSPFAGDTQERVQLGQLTSSVLALGPDHKRVA